MFALFKGYKYHFIFKINNKNKSLATNFQKYNLYATLESKNIITSMFISLLTVLQLQLFSIKKDLVSFNEKEQRLTFNNQIVNISDIKIKENNKFRGREKNEKQINDKTNWLYSKSNSVFTELKSTNLLFREEIFNKKFRKMFGKKMDWDLKTQKHILDLINEAKFYEDDFFENIDKIVKIALSKVNLQPNSEEYNEKYYLYFLQASMQIKFFNRNIKNNQERWQTGLQNFITSDNLNKIKKIVSSMDNFVNEVNFNKNISHDLIVVLGSTLFHIEKRFDFAYKELLEEMKRENFKNNKKIVILTSDRLVFNNKKINKIIKKINDYTEIKNISLTKEQYDFVKFYQNNNISLDEFKNDFTKITEDTAAKIVINKFDEDLKNNKLIIVEALKTKDKIVSKSIFGNKYRRANTVDTIKTLFKKYSPEQNIVFVTNQPYIQSQKAQIKTVFKNEEIEVVGEKICAINNDTIKIIIQNIAGVVNSNFEMLEKENTEAVKVLKNGIDCLKAFDYKDKLDCSCKRFL